MLNLATKGFGSGIQVVVAGSIVSVSVALVVSEAVVAFKVGCGDGGTGMSAAVVAAAVVAFKVGCGDGGTGVAAAIVAVVVVVVVVVACVSAAVAVPEEVAVVAFSK